MNLRKLLLITVGCIAFALGAVGAVLPILPTTPFLLLAACCFAKSSERLNNWFQGTKLYKANLENYVKGEGMPKKAKIRIMLVVTALMAFGFAMMGAVPIGRAVLAAVWLFHMVYFGVVVKTL